MPTLSGLDVLAGEGFGALAGKTIGLVCNQATVDREYRHILDLVLPHHRSGRLTLSAIFGPQHGLFGHTQDNMIEWEGGGKSRWDAPIHSLYGANRAPSPDLIEPLDLLVIDLPDIGSRYYTFLWTTALCLKTCEQTGTPVLILDRPNPIGGLSCEGPVLDPEFASFVGLYPLPTRHGMTLGEVATHLGRTYFPKATVKVQTVREWSRSDFLDDTDLPWVMPSPNMPTLDTAFVYPGGCLLEGTNLSEGRGTTRPFEIFGAPFVNGWSLSANLNELQMPGCHFRPIQFQPTFQKHAGQICEGSFLHVTDRRAFEPVLTFIAILQETLRQDREGFRWNDPPYEYEEVKLPFDILAGNLWIRHAIEGLTPIAEIRERLMAECEAFRATRAESFLYPSAS
jgi:uncharacterized protein YbbC (DUF1343 family)